MIEKYVAEICSKHCKLTTFKEDCPRGKWTQDANGDSLMPQFGKGRECPLMQFKDIQKMEGDAVDGLTVEDTWEICKSCRHAQKEADGEIMFFYNINFKFYYIYMLINTKRSRAFTKRYKIVTSIDNYIR